MENASDAALAIEVSALSRLTDRPSLTALSYALRHPGTWPKDFVWDYSDCTTCAIGLAPVLEERKKWSLKKERLYQFHLISPDDVADAIDLYLKEG